MKFGPLILMLCVVVESFLQIWGKELYMNRTEGNLYDQLTCSLETDQRDETVFSIIDISIIDYTHPRNKLKLASASVLQPDLYVQYSRNINMKVSGSVSQYQAKLDIEFSKHSKCDQGSYLCEVTFINLAGRIVKIHTTVKARLPDDSNDKPDNSELILVDQLTDVRDLINYTTVQMTDTVNQMSVASNQLSVSTNLINMTTNQLADTVKTLDDSKVELMNTKNQVSDMMNQMSVSSDLMNVSTIHMTDTVNQMTVASTLINVTTNQLADTVKNLDDSKDELLQAKNQINITTNQLTDTGKYLVDTMKQLSDTTIQLNGSNYYLIEKTNHMTDTVNLLRNRTETIEETLKELVGRFTSTELALASMTSLLVKTQKETQNECYRGMPSKTPVPRIPVLVLDRYVALCDTWTDGGGWIIIQRRMDGDVDFYRNWEEYKRGFGNVTSDYWLGNKAIHALTSGGNFELRVDMTFKGRKYYAQYRTFIVGSESTNYTLTLAGYSGDAGDDFMYHNNMQFSTKDRENDMDDRNCAVSYHGAWWYMSCHHVNLNGKWGGVEYKGLRWRGITQSLSVESSEMKIRLT